MKQTSRITSTYSADTMGVCSALFELGGMTIMHDASGCNSTYTTHDEPRWYDMDSMVYISALTEMEAIMGDDEKIIGDIEAAVSDLHPKFVAIAGTPIPTMTGFDFESVASVCEQRTGVPCFGFATTGMNTYIQGASMAFEALAKRVVKTPSSDALSGNAKSDRQELKAKSKGRLKVNILGLTPLDFSINGQDESISNWLESEGFEIVSRWAMGASLDEIRKASEADVNLVVSASGIGAAKIMYERFHIPYAVGIPIGSEVKGLLADLIRVKTDEITSGIMTDITSLESGDSIIQSGLFLDGSKGVEDSTYEKGFVAVIGEGISSLSLATAIEFERRRPARVLCATECPEGILRECDRMTAYEDDIIAELNGAAVIVADPLYKPICPTDAKFISLPHEAFSGRLYREDIPNLIDDPDKILGQI